MDTLPTVTDTAGKTGWTEAAGLGANTAVAIDSGAHGYRSRQHDAGLGEGVDHGQLRVRPRTCWRFTHRGPTATSRRFTIPPPGVLSLTSAGATATLAQWQAALEAVTYNNTSHNPTTTNRTISFVVNDGRSTAHRHQDGEPHGDGYAADGDGHGRDDGWTEAAGLGANTAVVIDSGLDGYRSRQHDAGLGDGVDHGNFVSGRGRAGVHAPARHLRQHRGGSSPPPAFSA